MTVVEPDIRSRLVPGAMVRIVQQIAARDYTLTSEVRGQVVEFGQQPTGSWYAHSKDDRLWLDRLTLRMTDGEITTLNLDDYSVVEITSQGQGARVEGQEAV